MNRPIMKLITISKNVSKTSKKWRSRIILMRTITPNNTVLILYNIICYVELLLNDCIESMFYNFNTYKLKTV